jgi:hypothetical protein
MPNWCGNVVEIKGDKEHLENLKNKIANGQNGSTNFMEYLIGLGDIPENYSEGGWYEHNIERFGTKWDFPFSDVVYHRNEDSISIDIGSAWSPITPFLSILCKIYNVTATILYDEPGCDFGGKAEIDTKGNIYDHLCSYKEALYLYHNEHFWETVESDFEEQIYDDYEEMIESYNFLDKEDNAKLELLWNANKDNL